ncbi:MAG: glycosyltransferase family protein [Chloroherpetonaceae bacterium]|nr:glycosyltransferase family protein [Chloroherpetonaceae bacterium]MDW8437811.1 glycosyltransferase family protein [Chloroherpetonaceae bacterium]
MKIVVVVQARTGSTRLPNKVMMPLAGKPLLLRQLERIQAASSFDDLVVATTQDKSDDVIRDLCEQARVKCFSGHPTDLLDRHYQAALRENADVVVKIPSDCPLIDPRVIDKVLNFYKENSDKFDYVSNLHPATYPDGNDVEAMPIDKLELAWREAAKPYEREHTTPFFWEQPERFRIGNVVWETGLNYSMSHRFTIDYKEDYEFIKRVYDELYAENPKFSLTDILSLLERKPEIYQINAKYAGVNWYRHHVGELKTISENETRREPLT